MCPNPWIIFSCELNAEKCSIFNNFCTVGYYIMKATWRTSIHWELSNSTKSAARGIVVWEMSTWQIKLNKQTTFLHRCICNHGKCFTCCDELISLRWHCCLTKSNLIDNIKIVDIYIVWNWVWTWKPIYERWLSFVLFDMLRLGFLFQIPREGPLTRIPIVN